LGEAQITWPVADWLAQAQRLMNDPLAGLLQGEEGSDRSSLIASTPITGESVGVQQPARNLVELGQQLYFSLFQDNLRDSWVASQGIAQHLGQVLRLRLGLKGDQLPRLPWEVMQGGDAMLDTLSPSNGVGVNRPIATGTNVVFSRYRAGLHQAIGSTLPPGLEPGQPLRILLAIAAPGDRARLDLEQEALNLQQELCHRNGSTPETPGSIPDIQIKILHQPGREQLTHELEHGNYQILHYAGHSDLGESGGCLYLVNERTGLTEILSGDDLAGLLINNQVHVAVFNSCRGAYTASEPAIVGERNLTEALISSGVPAVLAMAETIPDNVALNLSRLFYRNLKLGYPIDLSLSRARQGLISSYGSEQLYWALPVLYLHQDFDGYLTVGDRTTDNLTDHLLNASLTYNPPPLLDETWLTPPPPPEPPEPEREQEIMSAAVMADDDLSDLVGKLDYDDLLLSGEEELDYEEDQDGSAVAELIQQLSRSQSDQETVIPADQEEVLLPEAENSARNIYSNLPENPAYPPPPGSALVQSTSSSAPRALVPRPPVCPPEEPPPPGHESEAQAKPSRVPSWSRILGLGIAGGLVIGLAFILIPRLLQLSSESNLIQEPSPEPSLLAPEEIPADLATVTDPNQLTAIAITTLNRNELETGLGAVSLLLDQGNLNLAKTALDTIPQNLLGNAEVQFLRGRLGWQFIQQGNRDFNLEDVLRRWEDAVAAAPDVVEYRTALGMAYYANRDGEAAIDAFCGAIGLTEQGSAEAAGISTAGLIPSDCPLSSNPPNNPDILNAYAGLSLVMIRQATENTITLVDDPAAPLEALDASQSLQQIVLATEPEGYVPSALGEDWLWTADMVREWEILLQDL
jgi:hypothetical protein